MISIKVDTSGLVRLQADLRNRDKQLRYATAVALTRTAKAAQEDVVRDMSRRLHMPTRYTLSSIFTRPATRERLEAMVFLKDRALVQKHGSKAPADVLRHLVTGGTREWKNQEILLRRAGLLANDMAVVPGEAAPLDAHGNIPAGFVVQLLAYFRTFGEQGYQANMSDKRRVAFERRIGKGIGGAGVSYFVSRGKGHWMGRRSWMHGRTQHLWPGIWQRVRFGAGIAVRPVLMFVRRPVYRQFLDFAGVVQKAADREFSGQFERAWADAVRTAR